MQSKQWQNRARRAVVIPAVFALGAAAAFGIRSNAGSEPAAPPVQPSAQALATQTAFEQVADHMRPSVVYIESRQTVKQPMRSGFRQGADDGDGQPFNFPGFPGMGGQNGPGMQQRRSAPQYPQHAMASGSGVIVRSDGYILTNDHVVADSDKVTVKLQDGREFVGQVKRDFNSDLALIKIDATGLPAAEMANSDNVRTGQWAIAFGSPFGLSDTMTVGVISALHREQAIGEGSSDRRFYSSLMQTDASINPGNSGGPLVDVYGRVVGIDVAIESPSGGNVGIGFAIPSNTARYIMDQLITKGVVTRGYLGLAPTTVTYDQQKQYGVSGGALVARIDDGTPAANAGFQVEDVIVRYDGKEVKTDADLRDMVARTAPGASVPVVVMRHGSERTLNVTLGHTPDQKVADNQAQPAQAERGKLGVQVADATDPQVREQLGLQGITTGAVIAQVLPGSPAQEAGIQAGDVIISLDNKSVDTAAQLSEIARNLRSGSSVSAVIRRKGETVLAQISLE